MKNKNIARITIVIMAILALAIIMLAGDYEYKKMGWYVLSLEIIGLVTAYPKNKRWIINGGLCDYGERFNEDEWTIGYTIGAIFTCIFFWWFVWMDYIGCHWEELFPLAKKIINKKSPL